MSSVIGKQLPKFPCGLLSYVKGEGTDIPPPNTPCVIELWASWCGPCLQMIPHLSKLQKKYMDKGLRVISISIEPQAPEDFLKRQTHKMEYTVAVSQEVGESLMRFANVGGIPHAFVVDPTGRIVFSGHPADPSFEEAIAKACTFKKEFGPIKETREELSATPVRELKKILDDRHLSYAGLSEKHELVDLILDRCSNVTYQV